MNTKTTSTQRGQLMKIFLSGCCCMTVMLLTEITSAQTVTTLFYFNNTNGGAPNGLTFGNDGNLYGTTQGGGTNNRGIIFKVTTNGALTTLFTFDALSSGAVNTNGASPNGDLALGNDGNLYGTTSSGGTSGGGTVFRITTNGALTTLANLSGTNGVHPAAGLTLGNDGYFYGTAEAGGADGYGSGSVFKLSPAGGGVAVLAYFNGTNGASPLTALTKGSDGNLYGTTKNGGTNDNGTVFKVTPAGTVTKLCNVLNGYWPNQLALGLDGNLYGSTSGGGSSGTVFKVTTNGTFTTLTNMSSVYAKLTLGNDGNFYGTTYSGGTFGRGTVFKVTINGALTTLYSFNLSTDGGQLSSGLTLGSDGNFYGTTSTGGSGGSGTIFKLVLPPSPMPLNIRALSGKVVLSWSNAVFSLQSAPAVTGTYTNIPGATSPYTNAITLTRQFFRLIGN